MDGVADAARAAQAETFLARAASRCDLALRAALPEESLPPQRLHRAMRYSVFAGGKRLRPALVLGAGEALGAAEAACMPAMAAVELVHTYTLVHDDLPAMDDDDLRRGRPTCHRAFDEATAILAGDALQALAFRVVAELGAEAVRVLADAIGSLGVVGGQQDDLEAEGQPLERTAAGRARLERIHRSKTAALIRASCELGAIAAQAPDADRSRMAAYGEAVGLAFQIADDVLDATATATALGKTPGKDAAQGKLTYVLMFGLDAARAEALRQRTEAERVIALYGSRAANLAALAAFAVERQR